MPAVFEKLGIRFQYPENWTLDEADALEGNEAVTLYTPGGAFWTVILHPHGLSASELADTALQALKAEYQDLDAEQVKETTSGVVAIGYDVNFYCLDLTNTAMIRVYSRDDATLLVMFQADDREFEELAPVFRAITLSLLRS